MQVFAFEPFRAIFQVLTANVVLNGLTNVETLNLGIGVLLLRTYSQQRARASRGQKEDASKSSSPQIASKHSIFQKG